MNKKMKAALMMGKQQIEIKEIDVPEIASDQVLIRINTVGVCGSDLHYYSAGKIGDVLVKTPFILGHEAAGIICEIGQDVRGFAKGDRVIIEPGIPCGKCEYCLEGRYNICKELIFMATPPDDGAFAEYVAYPAKWVYKIPDTMSFEEGALIEPLAVGLHAVMRTEAKVGKSAFVFGAGCIGLVTIMALKSLGVSEIFVADIIDSRLKMAKNLGATNVFNVNDVDVIEEIMKLTQNRGVDIVYEMTGSESALEKTVDIVATGGKIALIGLGAKSEMQFDFAKLIWKEVDILSVFRYRNLYPTAIKTVSQGIINLKAIISDEYCLNDVKKALDYHLKNKDTISKMIIRF